MDDDDMRYIVVAGDHAEVSMSKGMSIKDIREFLKEFDPEQIQVYRAHKLDWDLGNINIKD